jgi:hypothetical protein
LNFVTTAFSVYVKEQSIDHLTLALKKANMDWRLAEFFPSKRETTNEQLSTHFANHGMKGISEYVKGQQRKAAKEEVVKSLTTMFGENTPSAEVGWCR